MISRSKQDVPILHLWRNCNSPAFILRPGLHHSDKQATGKVSRGKRSLPSWTRHHPLEETDRQACQRRGIPRPGDPDGRSEAAFGDINHLLRPGHLKQLAAILDDPEATENDRFVAFDLLKNANIAAGGVLPMCQDTGTAIIMAKKGRKVWTEGGGDEGAGRRRDRRL
jgi:hypothetical protein